MTLTPEQRERYVLIYMNERYQYHSSHDKNPVPFGNEMWATILSDDDRNGVRFNEGDPDDIRRQISAVAEAARKDLFEEIDKKLVDMVCAERLSESQEEGYFFALKIFRDAYLPTEDTDGTD